MGIAKLGATRADAISNDLETMLQQFAQGRFAMIQAPAHRYGSVKNTLGFDKEEMGIMAWPTWDGQGMGPAFLGYFWEVGISRNAPSKDAAAKFMRHLMNKESSTLWMAMGQQVPNRKSLLDHPFISRPENEVLALSLRIITNKAVFAEPPGINTKEVPSAIGDAIMEMMRKGQVDPALLARATEKINASQAR